VKNILCVPINYADFSIGVMELVNKNKGSEFTDYDISLIEKVNKNLADGLLQEEMNTHIKEERKIEKQLELKLNVNNLKIYFPIFNNLCSLIENSLGFEKAVLYLYDDTIKIFYDLSKFSEINSQSSAKVTNNEGKNMSGMIKIHSKRGFIGKVFSECEIVTANNQKEVDSMLETEEKNIINVYPNLKMINQTIGIPIESQTEDKVIFSDFNIYIIDYWYFAVV